MTTRAPGEQVLRFRDLGPLLVERAGRARPVGGARLESALALLLVHADRRVELGALGDAMWGDQGVARSASTLDSHIWRLRRLLEPDRPRGEPSAILLREPGGYRLAVSTEQVDSLRFTHLATDAADLLAAGAADRALRRTEEALALWRGRPFGEVGDQPWARAGVARLDEVHGQLRETHIGALLGTGAAERALAELEVALSDDPLRERLWGYRMTAYRHVGRRSEALHTYAGARSVLVEELGVEPGAELRALHARLLEDEPARPSPPVPAAEPAARYLPATRTRLVGREREVAALGGLVTTRPLVTLVGAAGCGKTRLAIEVARRAAPEFPDGVWFVDLTAAAPDRVLDTVSSVIELPVPVTVTPAAALRSFTRDRRMLVVLDNCEHVLDAATELVERLLADSTELAVLATSREPLEISGEEVRPLAPLTTPDAVELFLDRLDALVPGRERDAASLARVREIVAAVDGVPLALELAAGRARAYSLAEIATQVRADASSLSRVGRRGSVHHRTVRDAIGTSYRGLPAPLATLHRAAGAVPGAFTAGLAAALAGDVATDPADAVAGLVHRSLLIPLGPARPGGTSRFAQLATVRGHANHVAQLAGEDPGCRRDAWVERLVQDRPALGSPDQARWYRALDDDLAGLRATLQHTLVDAPSAVGVALAGRLGLYWAFGGMAVEGLRWVQAAIDASAHDPGLGNPIDRALVRIMAGCALIAQDRPAPGREHVRAGMAEGAAASGPDVELVCSDLAVATGPVLLAGDLDLLGELAAVVRRIAAGAPALDVVVRHAELTHALATAPHADLVPGFATLHDDARADANLYTAWIAASSAARLLLADGRPTEALTWARRSLQACVELGLRDNAFVLGIYATALARTGDDAGALRTLAAGEAQHVRGGMPRPGDEATVALLATITARLGRAAADRARAEGARATLAELVAG